MTARRNPGRITEADFERIERIAAGEDVPGAARLVREFRRKIEQQLGLPFPAERTETSAARSPRLDGRARAAKEYLS